MMVLPPTKAWFDLYRNLLTAVSSLDLLDINVNTQLLLLSFDGLLSWSLWLQQLLGNMAKNKTQCHDQLFLGPGLVWKRVSLMDVIRVAELGSLWSGAKMAMKILSSAY